MYLSTIEALYISLREYELKKNPSSCLLSLIGFDITSAAFQKRTFKLDNPPSINQEIQNVRWTYVYAPLYVLAIFSSSVLKSPEKHL